MRPLRAESLATAGREMLTTDPSIREFVHVVASGGNVDARLIAELRLVQEATQLRGVVEALMASDPARSSEQVMCQLEAIMDDAPEVAGCLMAQLYPRASQLRDAATCDAIALWMHHTTSRKLSEQLLLLAKGASPTASKRLHLWAGWVAVKSEP